MANILLIDADSTIPNLALMKLSTYHKSIGDIVELVRLDMPYYPNKKYKGDMPSFFSSKYSKKYCSILFDVNWDRIKKYMFDSSIVYGGSGYSLEVELDSEIEGLEPDYSIYPDCDYSIGFISRGCIRNCSFCVVPEKEGDIKQVNQIDDIVRHKKVRFLDNNFLALSNHVELLRELAGKKIRCEFNQGLDIRLLTAESSLILKEICFLKKIMFAFDDWAFKSLIDRGLKLLSWRKDWQIRFYVYGSPVMDVDNIVNRLEYLKSKKCLAYFMRDISCWGSEFELFYTDIAAWANQHHFFISYTFEQFLDMRYRDKSRVDFCSRLYRGD